ncbi:uncharacterized protein LOC129748192 [Uranotaenia lowii]|uniref:uncharacterized protein LOC129748192 n=1 Tax=Uranotaenia lowii TaxID=190385 RepID=UPI002479D8C4|nr:uncharacterized protein LOC129748192 [Uranotaenia lowii]
MFRLVVALSAISSALSHTFPKLADESWQEAQMSEVANESKDQPEDLSKLLKMAPGYDDEDTSLGEYEDRLSKIDKELSNPVDAESFLSTLLENYKPGLYKQRMAEMRTNLSNIVLALYPIIKALIQGKQSGCFTEDTIWGIDLTLENMLTTLAELATDAHFAELGHWDQPK